MTMYVDHYTKFKVVYFISTKDKAMTNLVKFIQGLVRPIGPRLLNLRSDGGGEFIANYYLDYCKTTVIIQQVSSLNIP